MKKINIIVLLVSLIAFTACDSDNDDFEADRLTVVGVTGVGGSPNITLDTNETEEKTFSVFASDLSNSDRSFPLLVNESETMISAANYSVPATVTIPANVREGEFTVSFTNADLTEESLPFVIGIAAGADYAAGNQFTVNVRWTGN